MKIISATAHGVLDYLFVAFLFASPTIFSVAAPMSTIMYALGGVHLLLTVLTSFPPGLIRVIPFRIHGLIEVVVAIGLGSLAVWYRSHDNGFGFYYFISLAVITLLVFNLTDFKSSRSAL